MNVKHRSFLLIWIAHFFLDFMAGVWPIYKTLAGLDLSKASMIAGAGLFLGEGTQLIFGYFGDKGYKQILSALGILMASSVALFSYTQSYWLLFIMVLFTFMGSGAFHPTATGMVSNWSSSSKGALITLFTAGGMIGAAMSQSLYTLAYETLQGNTLYLLIPGLLLAGLLLFHRFPSEKKSIQSLNLKQMLAILFPIRKELTKLYLLQVMTQTLIFAFMFFLPDILQQKAYPQWFIFGGAHLFFMCGAAAMSVPAGYLCDRFGHKPVIVNTIIAAMLSFYFFLTTENIPLFQACPIIFCTGGFMGLIQPVIISAGTRLVPNDLSSIISAIYIGAASCMAGLGLIAAGYISYFFEGNYAANALLMLGLIYPIAIAISTQLQPDKQTELLPV